ncbi:MAG TPA: hypothetical protein ENJ99_03115, partial [Rhizobiales bacterium]|nr:hypothetical protein [Hyphomicrobiales bacterium]
MPVNDNLHHLVVTAMLAFRDLCFCPQGGNRPALLTPQSRNGKNMQVKPANRHVLFLQGPGTLFFYRLAQTLENAGIATSKIHFSPGDRLFWRSGRQAWFTGPLSQWPEYLKAWIEETRVSDIVLFSDSRPYHKQAVSIARACGVNVFVFENGYLRPHWITLQLGGVNGSSPFPRTRKGVEELAQKLAGVAEQPEYSGHFTPARHLGDMVFHTINYFYGLTNRNFVSHRPVTAMREAAGWWKKFWTWPFRRARSTRVLQGLLASRQPFFLFSLQLDNDYQLVEHSPFDNIHQACEHVIASFANYAPPDCQLLIKNHPLDNNLVNRERDVAEIARRHAISDRVHYIETGNN